MKTPTIKIYQQIALGIFLMGTSVVFAAEELVKKVPEFNDPNIAGNLVQTTLGLFAVLVVIGAAAWAVKRFGYFQSGGHGQLKIVGGVSLGSRERVVLLQVGEQQLVLGVAPGRIQTLHVLDEPLSLKTPDDGAAVSFSDRLHSALKKQPKPTRIQDEAE